MSHWDAYPQDYRSKEVHTILAALQAGESVSVIGLSGAGKSNLLGFMAHRMGGTVLLRLVDCNRLEDGSASPPVFYELVQRSLTTTSPKGEFSSPIEALEATLRDFLAGPPGQLGLLLDRFDSLPEAAATPVGEGLRALRDEFKYSLAYVTATRRPLPSGGELAELFYAHTLWLGPLSDADAVWSIRQYASRHGIAWNAGVTTKLVALSWGYPSFLRACCEAYADGCPLEVQAMRDYPAVQRRVREFWEDSPSPEALRHSGLAGHPLLGVPPAEMLDEGELTAKEHRLLEYLQAHPGQVCEKDDLIRATWPEDRVFEDGIRDDSLAQLVRRLRRKIEADPANPRLIQSVPGRGYRYLPEKK